MINLVARLVLQIISFVHFAHNLVIWK